MARATRKKEGKTITKLKREGPLLIMAQMEPSSCSFVLFFFFFFFVVVEVAFYYFLTTFYMIVVFVFPLLINEYTKFLRIVSLHFFFVFCLNYFTTSIK